MLSLEKFKNVIITHEHTPKDPNFLSNPATRYFVASLHIFAASPCLNFHSSAFAFDYSRSNTTFYHFCDRSRMDSRFVAFGFCLRFRAPPRSVHRTPEVHCVTSHGCHALCW